jgi:hypothetical protein
MKNSEQSKLESDKKAKEKEIAIKEMEKKMNSNGAFVIQIKK